MENTEKYISFLNKILKGQDFINELIEKCDLFSYEETVSFINENKLNVLNFEENYINLDYYFKTIEEKMDDYGIEKKIQNTFFKTLSTIVLEQNDMEFLLNEFYTMDVIDRNNNYEEIIAYLLDYNVMFRDYTNKLIDNLSEKEKETYFEKIENLDTKKNYTFFESRLIM